MRRILLQIAVLALLAGVARAADEPLRGAPEAQRDDLRFSVATESVGGSLVVKGSITNKRETPLTVGFAEMCVPQNVRVRLYRAPERKPPVVWDSDNLSWTCRLSLAVAQIPARGTISPPPLLAKVSGRDLPESVPDGTYYATALIRLHELDVRSSYAEPYIKSDELPAGTIVVGHR